MRNRKVERDMMTSNCQEKDGEFYYLLECDKKNDLICMSGCSQSPETDDSDDESDKDVIPALSSTKECESIDILSFTNSCNGRNQCKVVVNESSQNLCQTSSNSLKITYRCVKIIGDCQSPSIPVRPETPASTEPRVQTQTTTQQPVTTSTLSPATRLTTLPSTKTTTAKPPSSSISTSTIEPHQRSLSTTLRVQTSPTGISPRVRDGLKEELSILDTSSIVGISIGSLALLVLLIIIAILLHRKRKAFKMKNNKSQKANVGNTPHYFTIEELPKNQYDQINDVDIPTPTDDYNVIGEDNSVKIDQFDDYNHISPAVADGRVGLSSDGYNHIVLDNDSSPKILDNDYNHINLETDNYNQLRGHNSFKNPKADSYHHILRPSDNEGKL